MDIVTKALEYYDKNNEKYNNILSKIKFIKFEGKVDSDMERTVIILYDKNKNEIFRSRIEYIGTFFTFSKTWAWSWAVPEYHKNVTYISRKIFNYGLDLDPSIDNIFLRAELLTSRFRISNPVQLDIHVAISSYLSKIPFIYELYLYPEQEDIHGYIKALSRKDIAPDKDYQILYLFLLDFENIQ